MYIIGGYLRLFVKQKPLEKRKPNFRYLGIFVGLCVLDFVLANFELKLKSMKKRTNIADSARTIGLLNIPNAGLYCGKIDANTKYLILIWAKV